MGGEGNPADPGAQHPQPQRQELPPGGQLPGGREADTRADRGYRGPTMRRDRLRGASAGLGGTPEHRQLARPHRHQQGPPGDLPEHRAIPGSLSPAGSLRRAGDPARLDARAAHSGAGAGEGAPSKAARPNGRLRVPARPRFLPALGSRGGSTGAAGGPRQRTGLARVASCGGTP